MTDAPRRQPQPVEPEEARVPEAGHRGAAHHLGIGPDTAAQSSPDQPRPADQDATAEEAGTAPETDERSREELLAALAEAEQARDEYLDGMQRARAEFDNFRRRTLRESASQREAGKAEVAEGLLEVLDDVDRTLEAAEASTDEGLAKGVALVAEKLVGALRAAGLERVDATGVPFDPNHHEAVQQTPADEPRDEPVIRQVLRPGYLLGERVLRAAMVVVEQ